MAAGFNALPAREDTVDIGVVFDHGRLGDAPWANLAARTHAVMLEIREHELRSAITSAYDWELNGELDEESPDYEPVSQAALDLFHLLAWVQATNEKGLRGERDDHAQLLRSRLEVVRVQGPGLCENVFKGEAKRWPADPNSMTLAQYLAVQTLRLADKLETQRGLVSAHEAQAVSGVYSISHPLGRIASAFISAEDPPRR